MVDDVEKGCYVASMTATWGKSTMRTDTFRFFVSSFLFPLCTITGYEKYLQRRYYHPAKHLFVRLVSLLLLNVRSSIVLNGTNMR